MPIYTKFGDKGKTAFLGGVVPKSNPRVEAYGSVDELNAVLGIVIAFAENNELKDSLSAIQRDLFVVGSELASVGVKKHINPARVSEIESQIDKVEELLPPLNHFILPGGSKNASLLHLARTICRRAERRMVALSEKEKINLDLIVYMNRLGDYLFVLARSVNYRKKIAEVVWKGR